MFSCKCPECGNIKTYKTQDSLNKCKDKMCKSCSNSIKAGGTGSRKKGSKYKCSSCNSYYNITMFNINKKSGNPYSRCKKCHTQKSKEYFNTIYKYSRYGITEKEYDTILVSQNSKCACCDNTTNLCIDHDHRSGNVRGILCRDCNSSLGLLNENVDTMKNLIRYLGGNDGLIN